MNKTIKLLILILLLFSSIFAKSQEYFWVAFTNKNQTTFSINEPEKYLSERAIQRRIRQNIPVDSLDLPVNSLYIQHITELGVQLVHTSKWLNGITVKSAIDSFALKVSQFPFVKEVQLTKPGNSTKSAFIKFPEPETTRAFDAGSNYYGSSVYQIDLMNGQLLHNKNYRGQGMQIAVLDAGFYNANIYSAFDSLWINNQILGTKDFVNPNAEVFNAHSHGMSVLSCMGGNVPGDLVGTAPKAEYLLLRTEDNSSEYIIEEDNWVAAAEYADSVGCDIINSSLGYTLFNDSLMNHVYADLDGNTTRVTQGANIAFSKGILVFSSAGNDGNKTWKYVSAPADGDHVIAVGAVNRDSVPAFFTSLGPTSDGDVKPNVAGVGRNTYLVTSTGDLGYSNGTSFSSPVMAGMAACLWQINPNASAVEIKNILEISSHQYNSPDSVLGYGIPDMGKAMALMTTISTSMNKLDKSWNVYPNPFAETLVLSTNRIVGNNHLEIGIYSIDGKLLQHYKLPSANRIELRNLAALPTGILLLKIKNSDVIETIKISKIR
ncbi:MAG: S8 family serine peptidase [Prolixibacteraceae bacterium]|nr:S8 family serine peptidase [Prolixibacteraceae bacterium]